MRLDFANSDVQTYEVCEVCVAHLKAQAWTEQALGGDHVFAHEAPTRQPEAAKGWLVVRARQYMSNPTETTSGVVPFVFQVMAESPVSTRRRVKWHSSVQRRVGQALIGLLPALTKAVTGSHIRRTQRPSDQPYYDAHSDTYLTVSSFEILLTPVS